MNRSSHSFVLLGAVAVVIGCAVACAAEPQAGPDRPVVLQLQWQPQAQFAGYMVALDKGFFREAGLPNVELRWWLEGDQPFRRVMDGKADFCTGWLSQGLAERAQDRKIVNIAQIMQRSALMLVVRSDSGITRPEDMAGRRVGLWGGDFDVQPKAFFKKYGVEPEIVLQSSSVVPFLRSAVDVASAMYYNEYHKLIEAGLQRGELRTFFFSDHDMNFPEDGIYCTEATRRDRPSVCRALVSASIKGWAYALAHEREALDIVMRHCDQAKMPTNRNHQRWMLRAMGELIRHRVGNDPSCWGTLQQKDFDCVARVLREQKLIERIPPFSAFYRPVPAGGGGSP